MPVSGNEETAVKSFGGQSSLNIAGVPMKKRRFIWPPSPTPEEKKPSLPVENNPSETEDGRPSQDSELVNVSVAASFSGLSDSNENFVREENKKSSENLVPTTIFNHSRFKIEEPSLTQSVSLAKLDDDENLVAAEKSANTMTEAKPLDGVPMKKRRFVRPPSPSPEDHPSLQVEKVSLRKEQGCNLQETTSNASFAGNAYLSDQNKNLLAENNKIIPDKLVQNNKIESRIKTEEQYQTIQSDSSLELGNVKKFLSAESTKIQVKLAGTELNLAPHKAPAVNVDKERFNQQIAEGKCKESTVSGNPILSLDLKGGCVSGLENQNYGGNIRDRGNVEPVSLNLSLSNGESTQHNMDDMQSDITGSKICADRSNWDLNTTMDTWEASESDEAATQVTADLSSMVRLAEDRNPLVSTGMIRTSTATKKQLLEESELRASLSRISPKPCQQLNSDDSLHLRLSPSFLPFNSQVSSSSSVNKDLHAAVPNNSSRILMSGGNAVNSVNPRTIKSEPFDESLRHDTSMTKASPLVPLDQRAISVKREIAEKLAQEASKSSHLGTVKSVDAKSMKPEPFHEVNPETFKIVDGKSQQPDGQMQQDQGRAQTTCSTSRHSQDGHDINVQLTCSTNKLVLRSQEIVEQTACPPDDQQLLQDSNTTARPATLVGLSTDENVSEHLGPSGFAGGVHCSNEASKESCESVGKLAVEMGSFPVSHSGNEINSCGETDIKVAEAKKEDNSGKCNELGADQQRNGEGAASDEEKINLSGDMLEEDSYGSEYESDGNSVPMDIEEDGRGQDDYEDGEVREPQLDAAAEGQCENKEDITHGDPDNKKSDYAEPQAGIHLTESDVEGKDANAEEPVVPRNDNAEEISDITLDRKLIDNEDKDNLREEPSAVENLAVGADKRKVVKTIRRKQVELSADKDAPNGLVPEQLSDQSTTRGQGVIEALVQGTDENVKTAEIVKDDSALTKVETAINSDDTAKDSNSGGNQSRIINLSITSNMSSFGKTRSISGRPLSSRPGRERLPDLPLEGDKLHPRGRDETYEGSHRFTRERYQDHSSRNSRWNYGRGRLASRIDSRNDRDSERDCIPRHKYASAVPGSDAEFMNYNMGQDGAFVGNVQRGRKLLDDETSIMRHLPSRRRSPAGRDGPASRGLQMVHRVPRSIGEDSSEVVGLRHTEKMMRGYTDDSEENAYTRPQPPYEGLDTRFVQGTRNFSSVQRRGPPQMRSKSPIRSRSPCPWSSSRRRSPDGFGGPPELPHRRSPIYRMDRIRSPDNPGFPAERMGRRHNSPSYLSRPNDLREMDPGRDHVHPRSIISNRSPNNRVLLRNSRRFGIVDPRERVENDDFFGGAMHSGRFHDLGADGNGEERRRFGDRRAPVRSFRPPFNGADGENFHVNTEHGPRSFRYFPEDDSDFHERANFREREFDRRIKNRPGNVPRRPRSIEEQDGNYRHGGQVLFDDSFDDMSRVKRKRF